VTYDDQGAIPPDARPEPELVPGGDVTSRSRSGRAINVALAAAVAVAIGGVSFAVGRGTAPASANVGAGGPPFGNGGFPNASGIPGGGIPGGGIAGGGAGLSIEGTVTAVDADSVTIKTASGQTIQLSITPDTEYHQQATADAGDVQTGSTVIVQTNGFGGRGPGGPAASPGSSDTTGLDATAVDITVVP
jgi:hypothetical protein